MFINFSEFRSPSLPTMISNSAWFCDFKNTSNFTVHRYQFEIESNFQLNKHLYLFTLVFLNTQISFEMIVILYSDINLFLINQTISNTII